MSRLPVQTAFAILLVALAAAPASAQIAADDSATSSAGPQYGEPQTIRFRVGAEITASRGACRGIVAMVTVPLDCPEQEVKIIDEEISPEVEEVTYRSLPGGEVKQLLIRVPYLERGATARAVVTAEVSSRPILPPERTDDLKIPKKIPSKIRIYTNGSPYIEVKHQRIRSLSKEVFKDINESATDWEKVEAIYDYVLENIEYVEGPDKGALDTLRDGQADCQGRSALFIALCRANKIPARMVWVDGHAYPEFYLEREGADRELAGHHRGDGRAESSEQNVPVPLDENGSRVRSKKNAKDVAGHWYPCESAGSRAFGEMPLARTILQKGDNFRVPERKDRIRYASDFTIGLPTPGGGKPKVKYIREQLVE
ncbi:MAG: transglutaminase domain-containing protein [Planctomycetes bacterium]|nr:transglutaminase domain-containing protein [Planctomycetota bacterium]